MILHPRQISHADCLVINNKERIKSVHIKLRPQIVASLLTLMVQRAWLPGNNINYLLGSYIPGMTAVRIAACCIKSTITRAAGYSLQIVLNCVCVCRCQLICMLACITIAPKITYYANPSCMHVWKLHMLVLKFSCMYMLQLVFTTLYFKTEKYDAWNTPGITVSQHTSSILQCSHSTHPPDSIVYTAGTSNLYCSV